MPNKMATSLSYKKRQTFLKIDQQINVGGGQKHHDNFKEIFQIHAELKKYLQMKC